MNKILIVFGTRPEAIKLAPVIHQLKTKSKEFEPVICATAQHRGMLDQVLNLFRIRPDYDLNIMKENQNLFDVTIEGLRQLEKVLLREKPSIILVQGDTTTTLAASLAAYYLRVKIGHVEAGLRTRNKFSPFPEELNRRLTDCLADIYFAPTQNAKENLIKEFIPEEKIFVTGNTVVDALMMTIERLNEKNVQKDVERMFLSKYGICIDNHKIILVTSHRRESFGRDMENICQGLEKIAQNTRDVRIIFSVHLNPNVRQPVRRILGDVARIHLIDPLNYCSFVWLMNKSYLILTDSGGIQEEAPTLGKPVLVMREKTERPEAIEAGAAKLVGTESERIFSETVNLIRNEKLYHTMAKAVNPYGDGKASERIYHLLERFV